MPPRAPTTAPTGIFTLPPRFLCPSIPRSFIRTIKSVRPRQKTNLSRFNQAPHLPLLTSLKSAAFLRKEPILPYRTGAITIKKGMTGIYDPETGARIPCTVLQLDRCQVLGHKRRDKHGYWAVQVGAGTKTPQNVSRAERGHHAAQGVPLKRHIAEFRVKNEQGLPEIGTMITADLFSEGQFVDARAATHGKGFAGGMKRHGWAGQPASHGNSLAHRIMGSSGGGQGSGSRVHPGKKMAGNMGGQRATVQNLRILKVDRENGIVVVNGAVPGPRKGIVSLQDAVKKPMKSGEVDFAVGVSTMGSTADRLEVVA